MSTYHHAYPEGLLVVERENRESLLLIGARSRPQKTKTGAKRIHRKRGEGGREGGKRRGKRNGWCQRCSEGERDRGLPVAFITASLME